MSNVPQNLHYTQTHEWARDEGDGIYTIGITDHAQELLGDIVFVELPQENRALQSGEECCVVESVKAAADVYSPLSGEVVAVNEALQSSPELINQDPYGNGWLYRMKLQAGQTVNNLMTAENYSQEIAS